MSRATREQSFLAQGVACHRAGDLAGAKRFYDLVLKWTPNHPDALNLKAVILAATGNTAQAIVLLRRAVAVAPKNPEIHFNNGNALAASGDWTAAVSAFRETIALNPRHVGACLNAAALLFKHARPRDAAELLEKLTALEPQNDVAFFNLARCQAAAAQPIAAMQSLQKAMILQPGQYDPALSLSSSPTASDPYLIGARGQAAVFEGNIDIARSHLCRAVDLIASHIPAPELGQLPASIRADTHIHKILYLPVEIKAREWSTKFAIANAARRRGFTVVIGACWHLTAARYALPPGIILFKTLNALDAATMADARANGHIFVALDEEAFARSARDDVMRLNVAPQTITLCHRVFVQGEAHHDTLERLFPNSGKFLVTGHPKRAMYEPANGKSILICLMSGNINNAGRSFAATVESTLRLGQSAALFKETMDQEIVALPILQQTIKRLAASDLDCPILVRPHPVEDRGLWARLPNRVALDESPTIEAALAQAQAVVYVSGCGTGLDAFLSHVPAVRVGDDYGIGISGQINRPANSGNDAADYVIGLVKSKQRFDGSIDMQIVDRQLAPVDAISRIIDEIDALWQTHGTMDIPTTITIPAFTLADFHRQKFPSTTIAEGRMLAENLFLLEPLA